MKHSGSKDEAETIKTTVSESAGETKKHGRDVVLGQIKLEDLVQERLEEVRKRVEKNTAAKKTVEKKAVSAVKTVEAKPEVSVAAPEVKPEVQAAEVVEEVKAEEKPSAEAAKKETEAKPAKTAVKKTTKPAAKKETETKPARAAKAAAPKVVLQMGGRADLSMDNLIDRVKAAYVAEGHSAASIKNIEVYIKPEECMAYYVIDGYASGISLY